MHSAFRFDSAGLRLSSYAQWKPVTRNGLPHRILHDPNPPITIEQARSLVWRPPTMAILLLRSAVFFAVTLL